MTTDTPPDLRTGAGGLSQNENPFPPLPAVTAAVHEQVERMNRYPGRFPDALIARLAAHTGLPADEVVTGAGSVAVIQQLVQSSAGPGDEVVHAWPSFDTYPRVAKIVGATPVAVPLRDATHDLDAMLAAITPRTRVVIVCNPNNPTGTVVRAAELEAFLDAVPEDVLVVLDEAYREFVTDPEVPDGLELYRRRGGLAVARTFSKAYGLAGLRVGWGAADRDLTGRTRLCAVPFAVSVVAEAAALACLDAEAELAERVRWLSAERDRVAAALAGHGVPTPPSEANFLWLPLGEDAEPFGRACLDAGVRVRAYPGQGVRVSIGLPAANDEMLRVAAGLYSER